MFYPEDFKNKVKEMFPDEENLHQSLDSGSVTVGQVLYVSPSVHFNAILDAKSLEELQDTAKNIKERYCLYAEWCELYNEYKASLKG